MPCNVLAFMSDHPSRVRRDFHCTRNFLLVSIVTLRPLPCQALDESWIRRGTAPRPRRWERGEQSVRLDLEERLGIRQAGQTMPAEAAEAETGRDRCADRLPGL